MQICTTENFRPRDQKARRPSIEMLLPPLWKRKLTTKRKSVSSIFTSLPPNYWLSFFKAFWSSLTCLGLDPYALALVLNDREKPGTGLLSTPQGALYYRTPPVFYHGRETGTLICSWFPQQACLSSVVSIFIDLYRCLGARWDYKPASSWCLRSCGKRPIESEPDQGFHRCNKRQTLWESRICWRIWSQDY